MTDKKKRLSWLFSKKAPAPVPEETVERTIAEEDRLNILLAANWLDQRMYQKEAASLRALAKRLK
jgi:hypothetical protein